MRTLLPAILGALLACHPTAQTPIPVSPPAPAKVPAVVAPATVKPVRGQEPNAGGATQDPVKVVRSDPKTELPKTEGPKTEGPKPADPKVEGEKPVTAETGDVSEGDTPKDQPLPQSGDPADLRAMRSAQEMVAAEKRLRERIKAGKIKDIDKLLSFEEISSWPYEDGLKGMPKDVRALDGKQVAMIGFMLPIDEVENIKEFLLVQSLWACCYGQPPDINGIVRVVMKGDTRTDYQFDPIIVTGTFKVEATLEDGYCIDIYQLQAIAVSPLK